MVSIRKLLFGALLTFFALVQAFPQESYKVLPASSIEISGTSTLSNWVVKSSQVSGEMTFDAGLKRNGPEVIKSARVVVDVSSIKSEKGETMDNKMYGALKHDSYPQIAFVLTNPLDLPKGASKLSASGNVNLAGVTKPLIFDLEVRREKDAFRFQGRKTLKLSDFDIEPPTAMFGQIETGDEIVVSLDLLYGK